METVTITLKNAPALYLEADTISPDAFAGKTAAQIAELPVFEGNVPSTLGKYFEVSGDAGATAADTKVVVKGDMKGQDPCEGQCRGICRACHEGWRDHD
jgi:formylmethanofuran dehydrogenase subunit C